MATPADRLELLETFIRIAETGGIGAAARSMDTAQPTVTRRLQQLEAALDAKLVERSTQGMRLTAHGAALLPEAREMLARWRGLEEAAAQGPGDVGGLVRVVGPSAFSDVLLPEILARFLRANPGVRLELRQIDGLLDLAGEGADFAVRIGKHPLPEDARSRELGQVERVLCAAPAFAEKLAAERGVDPERCEPLALDGAPLISLAPFFGATHRFEERGGATEDVRFDRVAAFDALDAVARFVLEGFGLALLPRWRVAPLIEGGHLVRIARDWCADTEPVSIVWVPSRLRSAAAAALLEEVSESLTLRLEIG